MSAWILDINGIWHEVKGDIEARIIDFITRLQTIKGEQSFNINNGLDFLNIINGNSLLEIEVDNIAGNFNNYFDITIEKSEEDKKEKVLKIDINIKLKNSSNNEMIKYTAFVGA